MFDRGVWTMGFAVLISMAGPVHGQRAVILVRHAEKESGTGDVALSDAGKRRAERLIQAMKDADIAAIYTTQWKRTKQTTDPLAQSLKLATKSTDARESPSAFAKRLHNDHGDQCVLVVGHSDTIPALIDAIAHRKLEIKIADDEFDNLFIMIPRKEGSWSVARARY